MISFGCKSLNLAKKYYLKPCPFDKPVPQEDFVQHFYNVDLKEYEAQLQEYTSQFEITRIDTIVYDAKEFPVFNISYRKDHYKYKLLILAGVHGNEEGSLLAVLKILEDIKVNPDIYKEWMITIITPMNPVGTFYNSRYNENGCDINRKLHTSGETGVKIQRNVIKEYSPDLVVSLHEAFQDGYFIFCNKYIKTDLAKISLNMLEKNGIELAFTSYFGRKLKPRGFFKIPGFWRFGDRILRINTLDTYCERSGIASITAEADWKTDSKHQRIDSHQLLIKGLVNSYKD